MSLLEQLGIPWILSGLLLIPYLCWGVYLLKVRFQHQTELSVAGRPSLSSAWSSSVVQFAVLNMWLSKSPVLFLLAVLGLLASPGCMAPC